MLLATLFTALGAALLLDTLARNHWIEVAFRRVVDYKRSDLVDVLWNVSVITTGDTLLANLVALDCLRIIENVC